MKILKAHLDLSSSAALDIAKKLTTVVDPADCPTPEGRAAERLIAKFGPGASWSSFQEASAPQCPSLGARD